MPHGRTDAEAGEVQYELIEACEAYPDEREYLRTRVKRVTS